MSNIDSNRVLTRKEKEELVLDLYFNQNKTFHEIAKIARMSPRDIKPIIDNAINEKERTQHKTTAVQAYELFRKGKTLLEVTIDLKLESGTGNRISWRIFKASWSRQYHQDISRATRCCMVFCKTVQRSKGSKNGYVSDN